MFLSEETVMVFAIMDLQSRVKGGTNAEALQARARHITDLFRVMGFAHAEEFYRWASPIWERGETNARLVPKLDANRDMMVKRETIQLELLADFIARRNSKSAEYWTRIASDIMKYAGMMSVHELRPMVRLRQEHPLPKQTLTQLRKQYAGVFDWVEAAWLRRGNSYYDKALRSSLEKGYTDI